MVLEFTFVAHLVWLQASGVDRGRPGGQLQHQERDSYHSQSAEGKKEIASRLGNDNKVANLQGNYDEIYTNWTSL